MSIKQISIIMMIVLLSSPPVFGQTSSDKNSLSISQKIDLLLERYEDLKKENRRLDEKLNAAGITIASYKNKVSEQRQELMKMRQLLKGRQGEGLKTDSLVQEKEREIQRLVREKQDLESKFVKMQEQKTALEGKLGVLQKDIKDIKKDSGRELEEKNQSLRKTIEKLQNEISELRQDIGRKVAQAREPLLTEIETLRQEVKIKGTFIREGDETVARLKKEEQ